MLGKVRRGWRRSVALIGLALLALAEQPAVQPARMPIRLEAPVQDKNFYLLSAIERTPEVRAAVKGHAVLSRLASDRLAALDHAAKSCELDLSCYAAAFEWNETDLAEAGHALASLYGSSRAVRDWTDGPVRLSGMYVRYHNPGWRCHILRCWPRFSAASGAARRSRPAVRRPTRGFRGSSVGSGWH